MNCGSFFLLFFSVFFVFSLPLIEAVDHIHIVDYNIDESVILIRGGTPVTYTEPRVDYESWVEGMTEAVETAGLAIVSPVYIIDINLMNFQTNRDLSETQIESSYFASNPSKGEFEYWETVGSSGNASNVLFGLSTQANLNSYMNQLLTRAQDWLPDRMIERQDVLFDLVHNATNERIVRIRQSNPAVGTILIYGHCDCGCDRTGQTFGSYYLRHLKWSWEATNTMNTIIPGRGMGCNNYLAMQWYCLYLNTAMNYTNNCHINFACTPFDPLPPNYEGERKEQRTCSSSSENRQERLKQVIEARPTPIRVIQQ